MIAHPPIALRRFAAPAPRSRTLGPVDDRPAWAITCFCVARSHRSRGASRVLVEAAVRHAHAAGARLVEAYPVDARAPLAAAFRYTGVASTFLALGFREVARRSRTRPILRRELRASAGAAPRPATSGRSRGSPSSARSSRRAR